jgi:hypothetical protein
VNFVLSQTLGALRHVGVLFSLRLLPFAIWAIFGRSATWRSKVLAAVAYSAFPALAWHLGAAPAIRLVAIGAAYYFAVCLLGANRLSAVMATGQVTRGAALVLVFVVFLLVPGVAFAGPAVPSFLIFGWELALSAYSYCVETSRPGAVPAPTSESLFFLLVNPTLVYTARGTPLATPVGTRGLLRAGAGVALMFANAAVVWALADYVHGACRSAAGVAALALWPTYGIIRFLSLYASHSGLASVHIGLMRQLAWRVPERYDYPLLSTGPMDFWRRWNTYVRTWLEVYVFFPIARSMARRTQRRAGQVVAAMATLVLSGLIHDAYSFAALQSTDGLRMTKLFVAACALLVIWGLAAGIGKTLRRRLGDERATWFAAAQTLLSRCALATALVGAAITWG